MRMQDEVLRVWRARGTTMLLVTHDIDEAIYMSDRIVIMSPRPGRVERIIEVGLDRPRERNSHDFLALRRRFWSICISRGRRRGMCDLVWATETQRNAERILLFSVSLSHCGNNLWRPVCFPDQVE